MPSLEDVKNFIEDSIGRRVSIKQKQAHRSKYVTYQGKIKQKYENLFVIELEKSDLRKRDITFNYRDVLTNAIIIEFLE